MITYTKLKNGNWGVRGPANELRVGSVFVTKKNGERKQETVDKILWTDGQTSVASIGRAQTVSSSPKRTGGGSGVCRECRGPIVNAPHHRAMGGLCGNCAFDEYDC